MKIRVCGAGRQVGRSQFEVACSDARVLLDSGGTTGANGENLPLPPSGKVSAVLLSHAHLDHSGALPVHFKHHPIPVYSTAPTQPLCNLLWEDLIKVARQKGETPFISQKEIDRANAHFVTTPYGEEEELFDGTVFSLHDAGHITGSAQVLLRSQGKTLLYSGDINTVESRMHFAAQIPEKNVDALVVESTYANRDHSPRKETERHFAQTVREALEQNNVLIPCFAIGRTQEVLMVLDAMQVKGKVYIDGMGIKTSMVASEYPSYCRDFGAFSHALRKAHFVQSGAERKKIAQGSGKIIIATAGMLDGGPALSYLERLNADGNGAVFLTGYQGLDTNGRMLMEKGEVVDRGRRMKINLPLKNFDFSAHCGRSELFEYVRQVNPQKVLCVHGDLESCELFARELQEKGFDAVAPEVGNEIIV